MAVDWRPPLVPALPEVPELVCAPPVLTTAPGGADLVACWVVEAAPDTDSDGALLPVDESEEVCVDSGAPVEPDTPEAAGALRLVGDPLAVERDGDDEFEVDSDDVDDEAAEPGSAEATPYPVRMAVPTPRATASPPTRPIYRAAPIASSWTADLRQQTLASSSRAQPDIRVCEQLLELLRKVDGVQLPRKLSPSSERAFWRVRPTREARPSGPSTMRAKNCKTDLPRQPSFLADNNLRFGRRPRRGQPSGLRRIRRRRYPVGCCLAAVAGVR